MFKKALQKAFRNFLIILFALTLIIPLVGSTWLGSEIFSPKRRAIQAYHLDRLKHPENYGLKIREHACLDGKVPCLLVEPDGKFGAAKRGKTLRRQVTSKGFALAKYGETRGTMVLLHGRNGRKEDLLPVAERFVAAGFRCLIPDLPAHGDSPLSAMAFGGSDFERNLPARVLADAREHFSLPDDPAILWGISMGGAFAVSAASEENSIWDALIVVNSFSQLTQVIKRHTPKKWQSVAGGIRLYLNLSQRLRGQPTITSINPQQWASHVKTPTLVVHGERDHFIPIKQGRALYAALASQNKRWVTVPKARHVNVLNTAMPLYAEMSSWLIRTIDS